MELGEKLEKGKELLVYNLDDGSFVQSFELPFEAKKVKVFNANVYALHDTEREIALSVLPLADL